MRFCERCGTQITEGNTICPSCGTPIQLQQQEVQQPQVVQEPVVAEQPINNYGMPEQVVQPTENYAIPQEPIGEPVLQQQEQQPMMAPQMPQPEIQQQVPVMQQPVMQQPVFAQQPVMPEQPQVVETPSVAPVIPPQPMYTPQQPVVTTDNKKSAGIPILIVVILLVVTTASGLILGKVIFGGSKCETPNITVNDNTNNDKEDDFEEEENEDDYNEVAYDTSAYISGHELTIPKDYIFEVDDEDILYVYDDTQEWISEITLTQYSYSTIVTNIETIINNFKSSGYTVEGYEEKEINGISLVQIKVIDTSGIKILAAYVNVSDNFVGVITTYNQSSGEYESDKFEDAVDILATAIEKEESRNPNAINKNTEVESFLPVIAG